MFRLDDVHLKPPVKNEAEELAKQAGAALGISDVLITNLTILKKSIDARKKDDIKYVYSIVFDLKGTGKGIEVAARHLKRSQSLTLYKPVSYELPRVIIKRNGDDDRPLIVGCGPAGLFCAYILSAAGLRPIVIERGERIVKRQKSVEAFWQNGVLNPESNIQFGEGGAGTFSDGKLYTGNNDKSGIHDEILKVFVEYGADPDIMSNAHPHIGTDVLKNVIVNMRCALERKGVEFLFETRFVKPLCDEKNRATAAEIVKDNKISALKCGCIILCTGHSARDLYKDLYDCGMEMEAKSFAVGFRIQHEQKMINMSQYGPDHERLKLPPAIYKLTAKASSGRGVYSFCMCPGGYGVNASSEPARLAVNGMSSQGRNGKNANSAIVVTVGPEEFGSGLFDGMEFQKKLEEKAYGLCKGSIPVQTLGDFMSRSGRADHKGIEAEIKGKWAYASLNGLLPVSMENDIIEAFGSFGHTIKGFDDPGALLAGIESRTSAPLRMIRNEAGMSNINAVFPCGEGAGYAGGITSAAADGIRTAEKVIKYMQRV